MDTTAAQRATLKTAILAEPTLAAAIAAGDDVQVAAWCNADTSPAFVVWRSSVATRDMLEVVTWTEVDGLTNGKARILEWMMSLGTVNAGLAKVRQGLADCFGAASASYVSILPVLKRTATKAEALLATGTGTDATPARLRAEGPVTNSDVAAILRG